MSAPLLAGHESSLKKRGRLAREMTARQGQTEFFATTKKQEIESLNREHYSKDSPSFGKSPVMESIHALRDLTDTRVFRIVVEILPSRSGRARLR